MRRVRIAIVDNGVRVDHPAFKTNKPDVIWCVGKKDENQSCGHGTAVYNIIRKTNEFADIINFKITDSNGDIDEKILISCLHNIRDNYDVDIINLSLGLSLCENINPLRTVCDDLIARGVIIISAFDNEGSISYPAAFCNVIGVTSSDLCCKTNDFIIFKDMVVNIAAKGSLQRLAWDKPDYIMLDGSSFACAHVTVQVARWVSEGIANLSEILEKFNEIALWAERGNDIRMKKRESFEIENAILFPFNKEMHSLIRFHDMLSFKIAGVYDIRLSSHVGSTTDRIMNADVKSYPIRRTEDIDWNICDTIILGNIPANITTAVSSVRETLINRAISIGKNIYSFDDLYDKFEYNRMFCPTVTQGDLPPERFGKLYRISRPVVGVYGTSSSQGKFTLQLELRRKFLEYGYHVGQIGSEPSAQLFGMDFTYPMGFNDSIYINAHKSIHFLNECINHLCQKNCDIIITGSQSSVLPYDTGNLGMFPLKQFNFLMGTQPDAVVLCINPYDEFDYIARSICFLESSVACKVIALCVYPMNLKKDWTSLYNRKKMLEEKEYQLLKDALQIRFSIPVYRLGDELDITNIFNDIIDFFTEN